MLNIKMMAIGTNKRFGFNVASAAQCDIPINCAVQILLLN